MVPRPVHLPYKAKRGVPPGEFTKKDSEMEEVKKAHQAVKLELTEADK